MENYYVYKWFIIETGFVFYIGKGKLDRFKSLKSRNQYFLNIVNKYQCSSEIIEYCDSEDDAFMKEKEYIQFYKEKGMATANFHEGGLGGDTLKYASEKKRKEFIEKMTIINRERCSSDEFKQKARENMTKKYSDTNERIKQSEIQKTVWTEEKRRKQSEIIKNSIKNNNFYEKRNSLLRKKCCFEFIGEKIIFNSRKEALSYIKNKYDITFSRKVEQEMLHNRIPYVSFKKDKSHLNGMLLYYI